MAEEPIPPRAARMAAWAVLMRQSEVLSSMSDTFRYEEKNPDAARALRDKANEMRAVADWMRLAAD